MSVSVLFLDLSTVVSILATLTNSYQPHAVALQGIIFQNILHFEKIYISPTPLFCHSLALPLCVFLCLTNTHCNMHTTRHAQLLLKPVLPP